MRLASLLLASLVVALAAPAIAQETPAGTGTQTEQPKPAKKPKEKRICRQFEVSGSRMSQSVCKTQAEWAKYDSLPQDSSMVGGAPAH